MLGVLVQAYHQKRETTKQSGRALRAGAAGKTCPSNQLPLYARKIQVMVFEGKSKKPIYRCCCFPDNGSSESFAGKKKSREDITHKKSAGR
jgi:hypothetical protein